MKTKAHKNSAADSAPRKLEVDLLFEQTFARHHNALFYDNQDKLYLATIERGHLGLIGERSDPPVPVDAVTTACLDGKGDLVEVTAEEALDWYVDLLDYARGFTGSMENACRIAAMQLRGARLRKFRASEDTDK